MILSRDIVRESVPENVMSLEGLQSWFLQNQLDIADETSHQRSIQHDIAELAQGTATLESIEADLTVEFAEKGSLSVESYARLQTAIETIVGDDSIGIGVSLESRENNPEYAAQMTLESLSDMISKAKDYLGKKYRTLMERARWMESSFFGGAKKNVDYANKLSGEVKKMKDSKAGDKLSVSGFVKNYLHLNGSTAPADLTKGLRLDNEMMAAMMATVVEVEKVVSPMTEKLVDAFYKDLEKDLEWEKIEENLRAGLNSIADSASKKYKGKMSKFANTPMLGGRQYVFTKTKVNRTMSVDQLTAEDLKNTKGENYTIPKAKELEDVMSELRAMAKSVADFQAMVKNKDKSLDEATMEASRSNDEKQLGQWILAWLGSYLALVVVLMVFPPLAIIPALATIVSSWGSVILLFRNLYRMATGEYDKKDKKDSSQENADVSLEANDAGIDRASTQLKSEYLNLFTGMAAHKNAILRAGLEYGHAVVKASGVEAPEPEVATA